MSARQIEFRQDPESEGWTATVVGKPSVVTQAKTLGEAHQRALAVLNRLDPQFDERNLVSKAVWKAPKGLSEDALQLVKAEVELRVRWLDINAALQPLTARAVKALVTDNAQTYGSASNLLGITRQRVEQIVNRTPRAADDDRSDVVASI